MIPPGEFRKEIEDNPGKIASLIYASNNNERNGGIQALAIFAHHCRQTASVQVHLP
jgi:hypothetical protein